MRFLRKTAAGFLLTFGFLLLLVPAVVLPDREATQDDRDGAWGCLAMGIPVTAWGGWIVWGLYSDRRKARLKQVQDAFYRLVRQHHGRVTVLNFAMEAELPGEEAKAFLDARSREFGVTFDVMEDGGIVYQFPVIGLEEPPVMAAAEPAAVLAGGDRVDVVLLDFPPNQKIPLIKVLREMTGLSLAATKDMTDQVPSVIGSNVEQAVARQWQQRLSAVGATVQLRSR
ncbi:ribosomal protein L7/L12 [Geitlerinema sp. PCC 7407]|uniref:ribosomal protein L7/L12 n=1 Tax=Geitlerinema sp. PCC 7407 TaxID=1173025 RepID=UPI00029FDC9C|nr:ribosomal protein L7/L12 [Geitlerinema sp. PCC 7407]AFY68284.1 Ribosomal protein L7/L12 [Geitlerinema sp. PCC 7407]